MSQDKSKQKMEDELELIQFDNRPKRLGLGALLFFFPWFRIIFGLVIFFISLYAFAGAIISQINDIGTVIYLIILFSIPIIASFKVFQNGLKEIKLKKSLKDLDD